MEKKAIKRESDAEKEKKPRKAEVVNNEPILDELPLVDGANANDKSLKKMQTEQLQKAIASSKNLCWLKMSESATPGLIIAVSIDGKTVFKHGIY